MEKIYQLLFEAGDYTKSYEEFVQQYGNVEKSKALYKGLNDVGDYTKSFEEFTSQYGFNDEVKKKRPICRFHWRDGKYGWHYTSSRNTRYLIGIWRSY